MEDNRQLETVETEDKVKGPSKKDLQLENEKLKDHILALNNALNEKEEYIQRQNKYIDEIFENSNKADNKLVIAHSQVASLKKISTMIRNSLDFLDERINAIEAFLNN